jgi:hypothetical protein
MSDTRLSFKKQRDAKIGILMMIFPKDIAEMIYDYQDESLLEKLEKRKILNLLRELEWNGTKLSQKYDIDSDLEMMRCEYDVHQSIMMKKREEEYIKKNLQLSLKYINGYIESMGGPELDMNTFYDICRMIKK